MPIIDVAKQFMLKDENHRLTEYLPGRYEVDQATADHWFVKAHLVGFEEPPPKPGTEQQAVLLAAQAARLNEPVDAQGQKSQMIPQAQAAERVSVDAPPGTAAATTDEPKRFAGRPLPKQEGEQTSFIDPRKRRK